MNELVKSVKIVKNDVSTAVMEVNKNCNIELNEIRLKFIGVRPLGNVSSIKAVVKSITDNTMVELDIVYQNLVSTSQSWNYVAEPGRYISEDDILEVTFSSAILEDFVIEIIYTEIREADV